MKHFYKLVTYDMIDYKYNINTWNIRRYVIGYIMSLKRKQRMKLKANYDENNKYHLMFNNMLSSDFDLLRSNNHKGCCVLNVSQFKKISDALPVLCADKTFQGLNEVL